MTDLHRVDVDDERAQAFDVSGDDLPSLLFAFLDEVRGAPRRARARAGGLALTIRVCEGAQWRRQKGGGARNMRSVALYHSAHVAGSLRRRHPGQSMEISQ